MIGLDANVLVRYIMQDDPTQAPLATALLESLTIEAPGFVALVSIVEIAWVLSSAYRLSRVQVFQALEALLRTKEIVVEQAETVWKALRLFQAGATDFADCLIERSATAAGCERIVTFDRGAVKGCGMVLIG
jgi:predicted nucleic-acid-binding protein